MNISRRSFRLVALSLPLAWGAVSLPLSSVHGAGPAANQPSQAALEAVETLRARKMGIDRFGNLWAWSPRQRQISIVTPSGSHRRGYSLGEASAVDIDPEWGAVGLFQVNTQIGWLPREDSRSPDTTIQLSGQASDICWVGPGLVAVSPKMSAHRVEIWDLREKRRVRTLGEETPLSLAPGVTRMRGVRLRYDFERRILYSLESFTGDLEALDLEGKVLWRARVLNHERAELEEWMHQADEKARAENDRQNPTFYSLDFTLARDSAVWASRGRNPKARSITLEKLIAGKPASLRDLDLETCLVSRFVLWDGWLVSYSETCSKTRRWP